MISLFLARTGCSDFEDLKEWVVAKILSHRICATESFMEYEVLWKTGEATWEPLSNLNSASELLRIYESTHLDSKALAIGSRVMLAATPALLSNNHQIGFFQFSGSTKTQTFSYFNECDMDRLITRSANDVDKWINSTIMSWYSHSRNLELKGKSWVVFSPYAVTKLMQTANSQLKEGFVDKFYKSHECQFWIIPISWSNMIIPR
jgi:hypothetical protein